MSRTAITKADALVNSGATITLSDCAGATGTDGHSLAQTTQEDKLVFIVNNNGSATGLLTVYAGEMNNSGQGNVVIPVGVNVTRAIGPLEGARFMNADGTVYLGTGFTGTIGAVQL